MDTLPETNIAHENPIFHGKYHQNGGFSMATLVSGRITKTCFGKGHSQFLSWLTDRITA